MLERFVFRRGDENKRFGGDSRTSATGTTSIGAPFSVAFVLRGPPAPARLYWWPLGPKQKMQCRLVAAHRNLVLLRLDYLVDESDPFGEARHDYFLYIADPPSQTTPLLRLLPACKEYNCYFERPVQCMFEPQAVGLLCCGEEEFAVAYLAIRRSTSAEKLDAKLSVLRSSWLCNGDSTGAGEEWKVRQLDIKYQYQDDDAQEDLLYFVTHDVVPFKSSLCWVDYNRGILLCDNVCGDSPKLSYIRFPRDSPVLV